ncbi:hypothetical protein RJ640_025609 [Escallonia rubra]|uniref:Bromo domain-containing protein n=1 Tax=Escallonia rubra TaxID=112253 RepID=A0AA88RDM1_9ASTE|nr:hypothetical protein RJ640_025609 [Escallonia rubra]
MRAKREIAKIKPRRVAEAVPNVAFLNADLSGLDGVHNTQFVSGMEAGTLQTEANMSGQQADLGEQAMVNEKTEDNINSVHAVNTPISVTQKGGSIIMRSQGDGTHEDEARLPHQDPRYKGQELTVALLVIKEIMKMDEAEPFNVPVNPMALGIPDYFDVIDTPMDFSTICNNLENGSSKYMNSEDVFKDVQYIWDNCCKYNKDGDYILELMERVKKNFMKYWSAAGLYKEQPQASNGSHLPPPEPILRRGKRGQECLDLVIEKTEQQQQDDIGSSQAQSPKPLLVYGQAAQPELSSSQSQPSQQKSDAIVEVAESISTRRRGRGPTRCLNLWNRQGRISISTNESGQPIGPEAPKLTNFLGTLARDGLMAPLTYVDWRGVPDVYKENMWEQVQLKFDIDPECKVWVMRSLGKKWKDWKSKLKIAHYNNHETDEERLADRDERVLPDQWSILVSHWNSSKAVKRSETNKANRLQQKFNHTTGTKSFARLREEERVKRPDKKDPSRAELFILTRTRKDGQPVNEASSSIISKLRERTTQLQNTLQNSVRPDNDILSQVMGRNQQGRVHTLSVLAAPNPTRAEALKMVSEANAEVNEMKQRMVAMEQTCTQMAAQMATMMSMMSSIKNTESSKDPSDVSADTSGASDDLLQLEASPSASTPVTPAVSARETRAMKRVKIQDESTTSKHTRSKE